MSLIFFIVFAILLGQITSVLGQAEKKPLAITAMKAVSDQIESDWIDGRWSKVNTGPFLSSTIKTINARVNKGIAMKIGNKEQATVCFNTELLSYHSGWIDGFLTLKSSRFGLGEWPQPKGEMLFINGNHLGWSHESKWSDPRPEKRGSLPKNWGKYLGLYRHGKRIVLHYKINDITVLESPWAGDIDGEKYISRTLELEPSEQKLSNLVAAYPNSKTEQFNSNTAKIINESRELWIRALGKEATLSIQNHRVILNLASSKKKRIVKILLCNSKEALEQITKKKKAIDSPSRFTRGGPGIWNSLATNGIIGKTKDSFAIDTIQLPFNNPWNALLFTSGHDFLDDQSALLATVHGDIWRVTGLDKTLKSVKWTRFATGLFQPLGLKVVNNRGFVICRDQITRLHDFNNDGEADYYENFNNDVFASGGGHSFNTNLETDSKGNFYFTKCAEGNPHGGTVLRVSPDGKNLEVYATGFRNPNGMGISPKDIVTVGDQQGGWVPETRVDATRKGGFYGYIPMHHRDKKPDTYDAPFAFVPRAMDNSAGGQLWIPENHWGALGGKMIHLSYGRCTAMVGITDSSDKTQGAMINLPGKYLSGAMRGRFNPHDGHMYISGLRGWQTSAVHDGCFQRLRFAGGEIRMPISYSTHPGKIEITFDTALDKKLAEDSESYSLEQWNYLWSGQYGSKDWSIIKPKKNGRDNITIKSATLKSDHKTVELNVPNLSKSMQFELKYDMDDSQGKLVRGSIAGTINKL